MHRRSGTDSGSIMLVMGRLTRTRRVLTLWLMGLLIGLMCSASTAMAGMNPIPEGAAVWFACTQQNFTGPFSLRCPLAYDPRYTQTFVNGFSRLTPENEFKMLYTEPQQGKFDFSVADEVAEFAKANGKTIRGHTLLWNQMMPFWLSHPVLAWTADTLAPVMRTYISTVVSHFATTFPGVVTEWDVVNEPLNATGQLAWSPWYAALGPSYIRTALEDAHAAAPGVRLMINEQGADSPGPKAEALLALATSLKQSGAPLSGVGFEAHVTPASAPSLDDLVSLWRRYADVGLNVEVTELDVDDVDGVDDPAAKLAVFERYAEACRIVGNCTGLTLWGVADAYSWLGPDSNALVYNDAFQATPAATGIHRLLSGLTAAVTASHKAKRVKKSSTAPVAGNR